MSDVSAYIPDLKSALYAIFGFGANQAWSAFRTRRVSVPWTATFQKVNPETSLLTGAAIEVLVGGVARKNLLFCQVQLWNESSRDVEKLDLLFTFNEPFEVLDGHGGLISSAKAAQFSDGFKATIDSVAKTQDAERAKHLSVPYLRRNREFHLASLNRGESARFSFWINADDCKAVAEVWVTTEKSGVRLISRKADVRPLDWGLIKIAVPAGLIVAALAVVWITQFELSRTALALVCCAVGACAGILGILVLLGLRALKRLI